MKAGCPMGDGKESKEKRPLKGARSIIENCSVAGKGLNSAGPERSSKLPAY